MTKKKKILFSVGGIIILIISYAIGTASAQTTISNQSYTVGQLTDEINKEQNLLTSMRKEYDSVQSKYKEAQAVIAKEADLKKQIDGDKSSLADLNKQVSQLNSNISDKQAQLDKLSGAVVQKQMEPKEIPAGYFVVGQDIDPGRYTVSAIGTGSNYIVHDSSGIGKVNTILGTDMGVSEYVVDLQAGDEVRQECAVKYVPIQ